MPALSEAQTATLKALISGLPDNVVRRLGEAMSSGGGAASEALVDMVEAEEAERHAIAVTFATLAPICGRAEEDGWTVPADTPRRLWRLLSERHPDKTRRALQALARRVLEPPDMKLFDELCSCAGALVRSAGGNDSEKLALALELSGVLRRALNDLPDWMGRAGGDRAAVARLAYRDATRGRPEAGPLFLEVLSAHLPEPWLILRVISSVMDQPADRFVAGSELAPFGERVLDLVEDRIAEVRALDPQAGASAGADTARGVLRAASKLELFESAFKLSKDGPWGQKVHQLRRQLADAVEARLVDVEKAVAQALPLEHQRTKGVHAMPKLKAEPDPRAVERARTLTAFLAGIAGAAEGGYGSLRARTGERLRERMHQYLEDVLERVHARESDEALARIHLDLAVEIYGLLTDERTAASARRRAAAA